MHLLWLYFITVFYVVQLVAKIYKFIYVIDMNMSGTKIKWPTYLYLTMDQYQKKIT